jgi:hypothetical protein
MNIVSIDKTKYKGGKWLVEDPSFKTYSNNGLSKYIVKKDEDMRMDLVIKSIYDDSFYIKDLDIILHINDIDNPLNVREGMVIFYPHVNSLDDYRHIEVESNGSNKSVKQLLGVPNKITRKDEKRKKFLDSDYSLPPVVMKESRPGVIVTSTDIMIGGVK